MRRIIFILSFLIISAMFLVSIVIRAKKEDKHDVTIANQLEVKSLLDIRIWELSFENMQINPNLFVSTITGEKILLRELPRENTIFLRFTETHCNACIDQQIDIINNITKCNKNRIIVLAGYRMHKTLSILKKTYNIQCQIYSLYGENGFGLDHVSAPYYFSIDKNFNIRNAFVALTKYPQNTIDYLDAVFLQ